MEWYVNVLMNIIPYLSILESIGKQFACERSRGDNSGMKKKHSGRLADVLDRNISTLVEVRHQLESRRSTITKIADGITGFCGSFTFVYMHIAWFGLWITWNTGLLGLKPFDTYPFGLLTMTVSLEAIFLSMFVLISQNRMTEMADRRADLDLQINLLAEYEITKVLTIVDAIADKLDIDVSKDPELEELKVEISPDVVLQEMEKIKNAIR
jgi:uncharacterized membrane protein